MTNIDQDVPVRAQPVPTVRLDRTRAFSTVHGDRIPADPFYRVHYMQNDLPFDANGILVPDDNKTEPYDGIVEGQKVVFYPLYTKERRELVEKKIARMMRGRQEAEAEIVNGAQESPVDIADDVNLESWLRGDVNYPFYQIAAACQKRFHKKHTKLRSVVEDLVLEEKIVPEDDVAKHLMRLLDVAS